jgi:25S rRNA (cytosine2278-C5)-methyltransferase
LIIVCLPRWVRVNTLKLSFQSFLQNLSSKSLVEVTDLAALEATKNGYLIDPHIPNLLAFNRSYSITTSFSREYSTGQIILQDKASCVPASLLDVKEGEIVLDACAAPGNKTTQLGAMVGAMGHVFAVEKDEKRAVVLRNMVEKAGAEKCNPP